MTRRALKSKLSSIGIKFSPRWLLSATRKYRKDGHNEILFQSMQLSEQSLVLDFGGYIGEFTSETRSRFGCEIHVFEPVPVFFSSLESRFGQDHKIHLHNFAVGSKTGDLDLFLNGEATRTTGDGETVRCRMLSPHDTFLTNLDEIDLIAMNIEGGEYDLIPALDEAGILGRSNHVLVQFHKLESADSTQFLDCTEILLKTHQREWQYEYVWESWRLRSSS
jgi:FkbM family methyltransferase